jgi:uncharacterized protein (DUF302 family)
MMKYYVSRSVSLDFDAAVAKTVDALKAEGFGVLTDIDIAATLKQKLGVEFRKYRILGACNPPLALKALSAEDKIGVMLPCNVIVQERAEGGVELAAIDPRAAMQRVGNPALAAVAEEVAERLARALHAV